MLLFWEGEFYRYVAFVGSTIWLYAKDSWNVRRGWGCGQFVKFNYLLCEVQVVRGLVNPMALWSISLRLRWRCWGRFSRSPSEIWRFLMIIRRIILYCAMYPENQVTYVSSLSSLRLWWCIGQLMMVRTLSKGEMGLLIWGSSVGSIFFRFQHNGS